MTQEATFEIKRTEYNSYNLNYYNNHIKSYVR